MKKVKLFNLHSYFYFFFLLIISLFCNSILTSPFIFFVKLKTRSYLSLCSGGYGIKKLKGYIRMFVVSESHNYEKIEEMKEAVTKVIDALTQEDCHVASQKLLERHKCIAGGADYFEGD